MRKLALLLAISAGVSACSTTPTAPPPPPMDMTSPLYGPMFLQMATSSKLWEIQSSQMALQISQNPAVRNFAQMIISDHERLGAQMMAAAQAAGMAPPPQQLMPAEQQMLAQLQGAAPGTFDVMYRNLQVQAHQNAIQLFQNYSTSGDNPSLRAAAAQALPVLQSHLAAAEALPVSAAPPPPPPMPASPGERG